MRLRAGWAREALDRRLAEGADPGADPLLQVRAERLVTPGTRATLAAGLERVVATADDSAAALSCAIPVRRGPVWGARHELMGLAGELRHMPEPRPQGVAMAERLLTEPSSVIFTASSRDEIARAARDAVDNMRTDDPRRAAGAAEHHFVMPSVAQLPPRSPVDSASW